MNDSKTELTLVSEEGERERARTRRTDYKGKTGEVGLNTKWRRGAVISLDGERARK